MKTPTACSMVLLVGSFALIFLAVSAAPAVDEEEASENALGPRGDSADMDFSSPWDAIEAAALTKMLASAYFQPPPRMSRVSRAWPQVPREIAYRSIPRQWRTDKRQVRYRQCYFNPISCFRK